MVARYELGAPASRSVRRERLQAALTRVAQRLAERSAMQTFQATQPGELEPEQPVIVVSDRGRLIRVPLNEVLYLKAELKYLTLRTATQSLVMDGSLSELEPRLGERFLRVHRNALVAKSAVRQLERHAPSHASPDEAGDTQLGGLDLVNAEVADGWAVRIAHVNEWLSVSRRQVAAVREALADRGS